MRSFLESREPFSTLYHTSAALLPLALAMSVAFVTKDSASYPFLVLVILVVFSFIDNHLIVPKLWLQGVKINALISVIAVLIGNAIWGIPGMFLSIPLNCHYQSYF
jgi:predicted PurR-regulated permease PerM